MWQIPKLIVIAHTQKCVLLEIYTITNRSGCPDVFCKKGVLRNFTKFTGKHLCQSLFFNKACNFIKKEDLAQVFSCEFYEISKNTFFYRTPLAAASVQSFYCF